MLSPPAFLGLFERLLDGRVLTEDIFLCTIFSGLGIGVALGMVIRAGASTGGMDIPPLVLQKWFRWPVSITMMLFDIAILLVQALFSQSDQVLYGIVLVILHTIVMDKMLMLGDSRTEVKIISTRSDEIRTAILAEIDRGVTVLHGEGGYTGRAQRGTAQRHLQPGAAPAGKAGPLHRPRLFPHRQPRDRSQRPGLLSGKALSITMDPFPFRRAAALHEALAKRNGSQNKAVVPPPVTYDARGDGRSSNSFFAYHYSSGAMTLSSIPTARKRNRPCQMLFGLFSTVRHCSSVA